MAAGENMKLACLQFEYHGTRNARFLARREPGFFRQTAYRWLHFYQRHIALERVLNGDGLCRSVWDDFAIVQAPGEFIQTQTVASEVAFECRYIQASQVSHRPYAKLSSFSPVTLPTPGRRPTGSGDRNVSTSPGWMTKSPSGLRQSEAIFARNLFGATPAEAVRCSSWRIWSRIARATRVAVAKPILFSVTSRYASSSDSGSTKSVCRLNISRTRRETAR